MADGTPGTIAGNHKVCVYLVDRVVFTIANTGDHPFGTLHMAFQLVSKADVDKRCCLRMLVQYLLKLILWDICIWCGCGLQYLNEVISILGA